MIEKKQITANYLKTTYLLFNKESHAPVCSKFRLYINKSLPEDRMRFNI